jgi:16S rRNA (cytosine967-C5)-methyltransferase
MSIDNVNSRLLALKEIESLLNGDSHKPINNGDTFYKFILGISIRRLGEIQFHLKKYIKKPLKQNQNIIKANLIIGASQILYMRVPKYAAVNACVELSKKHSPHHVKFINAILRQLVRDVESENIQDLDPLINIPNEIINRWKKHINNNDLKKIAKQHLIIPPALDIALSAKENVDIWCKNLEGKIFGNNNIRLKNNYGKIDDLFGYDKGAWWIQDIAAQLPSKILLSSVKKNAYVIDMCAAPGGKTAQLLTNELHVTSIESNAKRAKLLKNNLKRLNLKTKLIIEDATRFKTEKLADAVLIDAPCSSTGTVRKNPDILWRLSTKKNNFLNTLLPLQNSLLNAATIMVKPKGILIYSVCSLEKEEGENQIIDFIKKHSNFIIKPIHKNEIDITHEAITKEGFIRTFPYFSKELGGMDGFFIARLEKTH